MHIVLLVAGIAIDRCRLIALIWMAVFTLRGSMLAEKRKRSLVMVERGSIFPIFLRMTGFACSTQRAFVFVVFLLTGNAIGLELVLVQISRMAARAFGGFVLVDQRVFGIPVMAKGNLFPIILSMTGDAFLSEVAC